MTTIELWDHWLEGLEPELEGYVLGHPAHCLGVYHWTPEPGASGIYSVAPHLGLEHPRCPIEYEDMNIGLRERWSDGNWASLWVEDFPGGEQAIMQLVELHAACEGSRMPIFVTVTYGWSPSTPAAPSEYEWEFAWRPQTGQEILEHTTEAAA